MKSAEEVLNDVTARNKINIQHMVTTKKIVLKAMEEYAKMYHKNEMNKIGK